eukprot:1179298-Prorocentrum_minimum.AAC.4
MRGLTAHPFQRGAADVSHPGSLLAGVSRVCRSDVTVQLYPERSAGFARGGCTATSRSEHVCAPATERKRAVRDSIVESPAEWECVHDRLAKASTSDIGALDFSKLVYVGRSEYMSEAAGKENKYDANDKPMVLDIEVNSGGQVYFLIFKHAGKETSAVLKFLPSRLETQSELFGCELAAQMGISVPASKLMFRGQGATCD